MGLSFLIYAAFIGFLAYRNGLRAKFKGRSSTLFAFLTVLLFIVGEVAGGLLVIALFCKGILNNLPVANNKAMDEMSKRINDAFASNPFHGLTVELFGIGGYLLVRSIIQQIPDTNNKMPLWPENGNAQ